MIVLITCLDKNGRVVVSHGLDEFMRNIILPCESLEYFRQHCGATYSTPLGEWILDDKYELENV